MKRAHGSQLCHRCSSIDKKKNNDKGRQDKSFISENSDNSYGVHLWFQSFQLSLDVMDIHNTIKENMNNMGFSLTCETSIEKLRGFYDYVLLLNEHRACFDCVLKERIWFKLLDLIYIA